jgi:hypothetical protein
VAAKSTYLSSALIGHVMGKSTYTAPATYYVCLCTILPLASDTGSTLHEVGYTGYVRRSFTSASLGAVSGAAVSSVVDLAFATCGATGATAVAFAVCDASTAGNLLYFGVLPASLAIATGQIPTVPAGLLTLGES